MSLEAFNSNVIVTFHGYGHNAENRQGANRIRKEIDQARRGLRPFRTILVLEHYNFSPEQAKTAKRAIPAIGLSKAFVGGFPIFTALEDLTRRGVMPRVNLEFETHEANTLFHIRAKMAIAGERRGRFWQSLVSGDTPEMLGNYYSFSEAIKDGAEIREKDVTDLVSGLVKGIPSRERTNIELVFGLGHFPLLEKIQGQVGVHDSITYRSSLVPDGGLLVDYEKMIRAGGRDEELLLRMVYFAYLSRIHRYLGNIGNEDYQADLLEKAKTHSLDIIRKLLRGGLS